MDGFFELRLHHRDADDSAPNEGCSAWRPARCSPTTLFLIGGLADINADPTEFWQGFDSFFTDHEYFKSIEIGWTTAQDRIYLDNVHLTLWHADEREEAASRRDGAPTSRGRSTSVESGCPSSAPAGPTTAGA